MITPNHLKEKDTIIINSPSNGITNINKQKLLNNAKEKLKMFNILEDKYVYNSINGISADKLLRAKELNNIINNKKINAVISVTGGDFLLEILPYINFNNIYNNLKWYQGQSDTTILLFVLTTKYEIKTIYSFNATVFGKNDEIQTNNNLKILKDEKFKQYDRQLPGWKSNKDIDIKGRIIGGSLECIIDLINTPYDNIENYIEKYKSDGIIWFFDIDYMSNESLLRNLYHLNLLGYFKYTKLIILGRSQKESFIKISMEEIIKRGINNSINYIYDFDLGHTDPRITIISGSLAHIKCNNNEHYIEFLED